MPMHQDYERRDVKNADGDYRWGYYQWGDSGERYYYTPGNERSRKQAHTKARNQAEAIEAHKHD